MICLVMIEICDWSPNQSLKWTRPTRVLRLRRLAISARQLPLGDSLQLGNVQGQGQPNVVLVGSRLAVARCDHRFSGSSGRACARVHPA